MFGSATLYDEYLFGYISRKIRHIIDVTKGHFSAQALVSFKKYMPPPLPYFKVIIYPFPLSLYGRSIGFPSYNLSTSHMAPLSGKVVASSVL
jgi:hypothetical protein